MSRLADGKRIGFFRRRRVWPFPRKSLAMALIDPTLATEGTELSVHVVGDERAARVVPPSPYDPKGAAMRL